MARQSFKIEGLAELDEALKELPKSTARNVLKRTLTRAAEPIAEAARRFAPFETHFLKGHIAVSSRIKNTTGKAEYHAVMVDGGTKAQAGAAMRAARKAASGSNASDVEVYVGPTSSAFYGQFQEFGTANHAAKPFLRPAFDTESMKSLELIRADLAEEIEKARERLAKKAARIAAKIAAGK